MLSSDRGALRVYIRPKYPTCIRQDQVRDIRPPVYFWDGRSYWNGWDVSYWDTTFIRMDERTTIEHVACNEVTHTGTIATVDIREALRFAVRVNVGTRRVGHMVEHDNSFNWTGMCKRSSLRIHTLRHRRLRFD